MKPSSGRNNNTTTEIFISMVELYQDQCYDLLNHHKRVRINKSNRSSSAKSSVSVVGAQYDENGKWIPPFLNGKENTVTVDLQGQKEIEVRTNEELIRLCQILESARHTNQHALNARSSRSHCIVTVKVVRGRLEQIMRFVDLAGSEKIKQTKASGQVLEEARAINSSLSTLGRVLVQLNEGMKFISYRDSSLTTLLQDALRGRDKACIVVTVDCQAIMKLETRNSLNFAERCSKVKNRRLTISNDELIADSFLVASKQTNEKELEMMQFMLRRVEDELRVLELRNQHGRINPDFPNSTVQTFISNKDRLTYHMGQLQKLRQRSLELKGSQNTQNGSIHSNECNNVLKQIKAETRKVTNLRGLVIRQMTTGIWIKPKESYVKKTLEKHELQKRINRLNGSERSSHEVNEEMFSTIEDLLLDFKG